VNDVLYH